MKYKYGEYNNNQFEHIKKWIQKQIFFLLICVDPETKEEHKNINIEQAFESLLTEIGGLNSLLSYPNEIVHISNLLEAARLELNSPEFSLLDFKHSKFRKLILDAGAKVNNIKEV